MSLENEIKVYNKAKVSLDNCEIDAYDEVIFPNVIRKRELEIIFDLINEINPKEILDYGCGGGWLSRIISSNGYDVTGVDLNKVLIDKARLAIPEAEFHAADCTNLPFKDNSFDLVIGMGILHHLDLEKSLKELNRVTKKNKYIIFMEPNKFNPPGFIGRMFFPLDIHTEDEAPFNPFELKKIIIKNGFKIKKLFYLFPYSFGISYLIGKTRWSSNNSFKTFYKPFDLLERLLEKIPGLNILSSTIVIVMQK